MMDRIDPIRGDIAELRRAMEHGFVTVRLDIETAVQRSAKEQIRYLFLAWGLLLAAIVGLYGTVITLVR